MELVDTHVHFWDLRQGGISYPWLSPGKPHPILGEIDQIKSPLYDAQAFIAESRHSGITKVVHVEADARSANPRAETDWLEAMARSQGMPHAIIAHVDLAAPEARDRLASERACALVRGVRDFGATRYLRDSLSAPGFENGVAALEESGLVFDLDCAWQEMPAARDLARQHPGLAVVLEHIGFPRRRDADYFAQWKEGIRVLATAENVSCKLSGLGMTDRNWTIDSLRPWVETCIEAFGTERCLYGSNWPVDRIAGSYTSAASAFLALISNCTDAEQVAICSGNAVRAYHLGES